MAPGFRTEHHLGMTSEATQVLEALLQRSGVALSEHKAFALHSSVEPATTLLVYKDEEPVAAVVMALHGTTWNLELLAEEDHALAEMIGFDAAMVLTEGHDVQLWEPARGTSVQLEEAISRYDLLRERNLLQLRRSLASAPPIPSTLGVRTFTPATDAASFLAANNAAFAGHPEQGVWNEATLDERLASPWFDPQLFLVYEERDVVTAWCWCKVDQTVPSSPGEIYVIGTLPEAQGRGLGAQLLELGCAAMATLGVREVELFVEADNPRALGLYERAGFATIGQRRSWLFS